MTLLLAIEKDDKIYYAGDRCESFGYSHRVLPHSKFIAHRGWRIGIAGSSKFGTLLLQDGRWRSILGPAGEESVEQVFAFARACQEIVAADGWKPEQTERQPGNFSMGALIVSPIGIFVICGAASVRQYGAGQMVAMGAGSDFAEGFWAGCHGLDKKRTIEQQMQACLEAASKQSCSVAPPFDFGCIGVRPGARPMLWEGGDR